MSADFDFVCLACGGALVLESPVLLVCPADGLKYEQRDGIWRFLLPAKMRYYEQFRRDYGAVRRAEGRGSSDPEYYRRLPYTDANEPFAADWLIRQKSFEMLMGRVVLPRAAERNAMRALDLGCGNGWLANRLTLAGCRVAAVDLQDDAGDGLGASGYYDCAFCAVQAAYDHLPFGANQFDLIIYNAALHYSEDYFATLKAGLNVLAADGQIVILDSPVYHDSQSGTAMVVERAAEFERRYGMRSEALPSRNFLTYGEFESLAQELGIRWRWLTPNYGLRWLLRPWLARLLGRREPANFHIILGTRVADGTKR